eukprot:scaffold1033_cov408-Prasinococcus_capsulatus_cf.AAC.24
MNLEVVDRVPVSNQREPQALVLTVDAFDLSGMTGNQKQRAPASILDRPAADVVLLNLVVIHVRLSSTTASAPVHSLPYKLYRRCEQRSQQQHTHHSDSVAATRREHVLVCGAAKVEYDAVERRGVILLYLVSPPIATPLLLRLGHA